MTMVASQQTPCIAFEGSRRIASGDLAHVAVKTKPVIDRGGKGPVLIFHDRTGELIEVDFRGTVEDVLERLAGKDGGPAPGVQAAAEPEARGPGRPKLGVVAREVTLLPRHWDWLGTQSGGASVALRKLVEEARRANDGKDRLRQAQEAAYRFLSAMAGNQAGFEEATRALFGGNQERFNEMSESWPPDVREHARKMAGAAFQCVMVAS
jgi:hypothetical protein